MTTFSDPGFRVNGPDENPDDEHDGDAELELEDLDDLDVEDLDIEDLEIEDLDELGVEDADLEEPDIEEADLGVEDSEELDDEQLVDEAAVEEELLSAPVVEQPEVPVPATEQVAPAQVSPFWSTSQIMAVAQRALAVFVVMGLIGYGLGSLRGSSSVARSEFVYTLDESVPDSFLREDRRLLTQVVTFKSDAVLTPVAEQFDLSVDDLRAKIDVETLNLSEVLRLDVRDADETRAVAISMAVLDQYLQVIADATPAGDSEELAQQRVDVTTRLSEADAARLALATAQERDVALRLQQQSLERQIGLKSEQINRLQGSLDDSLVQRYPVATLTALRDELTGTQTLLTDLETELATIGTQRAKLATETTTEPALLREIVRLESILSTIDDELAQRELGPLVASPIRELSEPVVLFRSRHIVGLQGMALGLMAAIPLAGLLAYRTRRRQLWFD